MAIAKIARTAKDRRDCHKHAVLNFGNYQFWQCWQSRTHRDPSLPLGISEVA
jgi:hypothetical protein